MEKVKCADREDRNQTKDLRAHIYRKEKELFCDISNIAQSLFNSD